MKMRTSLLAAASVTALCGPAFGDDAAIEKRLDAMHRMIEAQQHRIDSQRHEIAAQRKEIDSLRHHRLSREDPAEEETPPPAQPAAAQAHRNRALEARMDAQERRVDTLTQKFAAVDTQPAQPRHNEALLTMKKGRPTFSSAGGQFTAAITALGQFDAAYYGQGARAAATNAPDLSSGANFRRAQLGIKGTAFGDWSYYFNYDFAGADTESPGHIQSLYAEYDGLKHFAFRLGAYSTPAGLEDMTPTGDTIFLERNSPSDLARNIAGGDGRDSASAIYTDDRFYTALSFTGDKVSDTGFFDEQEAFLGRSAALAWSDTDTKLLVSANGTYVFKTPDLTAGPAPALHSVTLSDPPELTVDDNALKLVSSGAVNAAHISEWGVEGAAQWRNLYGQVGYFDYAIDRMASATPLPHLHFNGWYGQASWVLTGEPRVYSSANASFSSPVPDRPFSLSNDDWGAWEIAARYSDLDLNDNAGLSGDPVSALGLRGGDQRIWTVGLNWYPNTIFRFLLDYQNIKIGKPSSSGEDAGQSINTVSLRSQISF